MTTTNGGNGAPAATDKPPQLNVLAQYIKDFSFENPSAPRSMAPDDQNPSINIQVAVNANPLNDNDIEVTLKIDGKAERAGGLLFGFELEYAGTFRILNAPQEILHQIVMIECPRLLFPFAREIIATTVSKGGFPPLLIDPVDFVGLYRQNLAKMQPGGATASA